MKREYRDTNATRSSPQLRVYPGQYIAPQLCQATRDHLGSIREMPKKKLMEALPAATPITIPTEDRTACETPSLITTGLYRPGEQPGFRVALPLYDPDLGRCCSGSASKC